MGGRAEFVRKSCGGGREVNLSGKGDWKVRQGIAEGESEMESPPGRLGVGTGKGEIEEMVKGWFFTST